MCCGVVWVDVVRVHTYIYVRDVTRVVVVVFVVGCVRDRRRQILSAFRSQRVNLFQVPMLAEYFEESLILIRQTVCWKTVCMSAHH